MKINFGSFDDFIDYLIISSPKNLEYIFRKPMLRKGLLKILDSVLKRRIYSEDVYSRQVQNDKYAMFSAFMYSIDKAATNANKNKDYIKALTTKVLPNILRNLRNSRKTKLAFKEKYGIMPPGFLTISPGKFCNLHCTGCYANSSSEECAKLDWDVVDKIVTEKTKDWGSWFTVISGGEPFAYRSQGKDIIDLAEKHPDNLFLIYTNSTLITKENAKRIAEAGNITPAISVEGFSRQTDARRGPGMHQKILTAFENLNEVGVPFGISVTATAKNAMLVTSEQMMDYYFSKGASYAWMFQLMPIGRADTAMMVKPKQRLAMFDRIKHLIKDKKYFIADFWNCGAVVDGCISAGKSGGSGYLYIEWNGNITPCVFNPYSVANINDLYKEGKSLNDAVMSPYFEKIREWQKNYGFQNKNEGYGNWILPCPMKDHYAEMKKMILATRPTPIDLIAKKALKDLAYEKEMGRIDKAQEKIINPIWESDYCAGCGKKELALEER